MIAKSGNDLFRLLGMNHDGPKRTFKVIRKIPEKERQREQQLGQVLTHGNFGPVWIVCLQRLDDCLVLFDQ
jgi:hypothetical protein